MFLEFFDCVYAQNKSPIEACSLFNDMEKMGEVIYDVVALFKSALLACAHSGALQIGKYIHDQVNNTKVKTKIDEVKYRSKPQ